MELHSLTVAELVRLIEKKETSPKEVLEALAKRIDAVDPDIQAYLSHDVDHALDIAGKQDPEGPLAGVPVGIKDNINVKGQPCTAASQILKNFVSPYDATVTQRLMSAGAVPFGRLNLDEFAMGSSTENSSFQPTRNPWDPRRVAGGSSGGSAAAVAADCAIAALGSDTGGSIRQPAAFCGCVGLKPTYGRVSRYGLIAFASSLDQIGTLTKTVEDTALLLNTLAGADPMDSTSARADTPDFAKGLDESVKGLKIGLPTEYFIDGMDQRVSDAVQKSIRKFEDLGAEIVEVELPHTAYAMATYYIIATAEASANLARFDGVRYGHRTPDPDGILEMYTKSREEGFGDEVKRRIILGTFVLSSGYHDAFYLKAQKTRTLIQQDFNKVFQKVDLIACPTSPMLPFKIGEKAEDPLQMYLADIFTIAVNLAGICGVSLPCDVVEEDGTSLPVGMQLIGNAFQEETLLRAAHQLEQALDFRAQYQPPTASK